MRRRQLAAERQRHAECWQEEAATAREIATAVAELEEAKVKAVAERQGVQRLAADQEPASGRAVAELAVER